MTAISKKLTELLEVDVKERELNNKYRLHKLKKPSKNPEFILYLKKTEILKECRKLKGTGIAISNDLTTNKDVNK